MTTEAPPKVNMVYVYCTGTLPNGKLCKRLLAIVPSLQHLQGVTFAACHRCKKVASF